MRLLPFSHREIIDVAAALALPLFPLVLIEVPLIELIKRIIKTTM
jgi:hypothetical protein